VEADKPDPRKRQEKNQESLQKCLVACRQIPVTDATSWVKKKKSKIRKWIKREKDQHEALKEHN
jgi:hypothetical protein